MRVMGLLQGKVSVVETEERHLKEVQSGTADERHLKKVQSGSAD